MYTVYFDDSSTITIDDQNKAKLTGSSGVYVPVVDTDGKHQIVYLAHIVRIA